MKNLVKIVSLIACILLIISTGFKNNTQKHSENMISDSTKIDKQTGLIIDKNLDLVTAHCTACHSGKLITQFHTDRQGWLEKIRWMQQKQKMWDLGESEAAVLDYLAKNYPPSNLTNRRAALKNIEWHKLK
jgi:hypothetical protein